MTLELKELEAAAEGLLFAAGEPVHIDRICLALELDRLSAEEILRRLGDYYAFERRGIRLIQIEESWQLCSAPEFGPMLRRAFEIRKSAKLSQPALEVLSVIAYYQPAPSGCCWTESSSRSAGGSRCRAGPGSTGQRTISCAASTCAPWRSCRSCRG